MKIFLALTASSQYPLIPHELRYPYRLCSYFYLRDEPPTVHPIHMETSRDGSEWIMDSGLFSYMFGGAKGQLTTYDDFKRYAATYVEKMHKWGWKHAIVECDTQRLLGLDATEKLRDEVFRQSGLEVIYVWHLPEKIEGLVKLASENSRIAISVPELREVYGYGGGAGDLRDNTVRKVTLKLMSILNKLPAKPRIHLLGNTEVSLLSFDADSCDSSTWTASGRWGNGIYYDVEKRAVATASIYSPRWRAWREWCFEHYADVFLRLRKHYTTAAQHVYYDNATCGAIATWCHMIRLNGTDEAPITPASHASAMMAREETP